jgi:DNA-directed RNA polymerase subunit RPC12/RpoP
VSPRWPYPRFRIFIDPGRWIRARAAGAEVRKFSVKQHLSSKHMTGFVDHPNGQEEVQCRRLVCKSCGHDRILDAAWMEELRSRAPQTEIETQPDQLLPRFRCGQCQAKNCEILHEHSFSTLVQPVRAPLCTQCGETIPHSRLKAVPGTPFCVRCQGQFEQPQKQDEPVYCNRCGAMMVLRVRESILPTKYFLGCSNYPRCRFVISSDW